MVDDAASQLAINGGPPVRTQPPPRRILFGEAELEAVKRVFEHAWESGRDFGYQGRFEDEFTRAFCEFQGGGFADAVSSGTAAVFVALQALDLPKGSDVVVSPITNPGSVCPAVLLGHRLVVADAAPGLPVTGPEEFERALTAETAAAVITHAGGFPCDMPGIMDIAKTHGLEVVEDCSQAHGALCGEIKVGRFGSIAAYSTMFSKTLSTGGCGGLVYTLDEDLYWRARSCADRGKPFDDPEFDFRNVPAYRFPALNFNLDEMSCAIGRSVLSRLPGILAGRRDIAARIDTRLGNETRVVKPVPAREGFVSSVFYHPVAVDTSRLNVSKREFAEAVAAEGIWINPHYREIVAEWPWLREHCACPPETPNAVAFRDGSFNLLLHERFSSSDIDDILAAIKKVEAAFVADGGD